MNAKITPEHLRRAAAVYVRQSTHGQVVEHTESKRRQYELAQSARSMGFTSVTVIDDDLGRSGSGLVERPGFDKLVTLLCQNVLGAVFCIEASRLARNGRDWHLLIDFCALVGAVIVDPDGVYDPRQLNDRLLLGLKGTMSEYELALLRQRALAARDSKAQRGELRFALPPGYCWDELGRIEIDPDERVAEAIRLVFQKFREYGSARQVMKWAAQCNVTMPVYRQNRLGARIEWMPASYHRILAIVRHPIYAGAYVYGRTTQHTRIENGRARKSIGHSKAQAQWSVLLHDNHTGYISWNEYEENQRMLGENAHMQKRASRKSGRGGRALLTGIVRCGRCARMMRVLYGAQSGHAHRYLCRGETDTHGGATCIGIGGVRVDRAVAAQLLETVSEHALEAACLAAEQLAEGESQVKQALERERDEARYESELAARRYEAVDPDKRHVARELEARWNAALEHVAELDARIAALDKDDHQRPAIDRAALSALAHDLPGVWNACDVQPQTKQRLTRILIQEVVLDIDEASNEALVLIHWTGGRHTPLRVARVRSGRHYSEVKAPSAVEVIRALASECDDRELAVTMNRMRCPATNAQPWTAAAVRTLRERLAIAAFDPTSPREETLSIAQATKRLGISRPSVFRLIHEGLLPAKQSMKGATWRIPLAALDDVELKRAVRDIAQRRPNNFKQLQDTKTLKLPGF